jgi:hypothetical protein
MLLLALQWGGTTYAWKSATIIGLFCGFGGLIPIFIAWQLWLGDNAMIPPRLILKRTVIAIVLTAFFEVGCAFVIIYYLPEWFQVVKGVSPIKSGEMSVPLFISQIISTGISSGSVEKIGYFNPWLLFGAMFQAIGTGLYGTFKVSTSHSAWIGYQVLQGLGLGPAFQMPLIAIQATLTGSDTPIGIALLTFTQFLGGSIFVSVAQTVFAGGLKSQIAKNVPGLDGAYLLQIGSAAVRKVVSSEDLPGVLMSYNSALVNCFYLAAGIAAAGFVTALFIDWKSIKGTNLMAGPEV